MSERRTALELTIGLAFVAVLGVVGWILWSRSESQKHPSTGGGGIMPLQIPTLGQVYRVQLASKALTGIDQVVRTLYELSAGPGLATAADVKRAFGASTPADHPGWVADGFVFGGPSAEFADSPYVYLNAAYFAPRIVHLFMASAGTGPVHWRGIYATGRINEPGGLEASPTVPQQSPTIYSLDVGNNNHVIVAGPGIVAVYEKGSDVYVLTPQPAKYYSVHNAVWPFVWTTHADGTLTTVKNNWGLSADWATSSTTLLTASKSSTFKIKGV